MAGPAAKTARARKPHTKNLVSALERGIVVLRCIEAEGKALANGEISRRTGIPKPTVTRLVSTLAALGFLKPSPDSDRYGLGAGVVSLARSFLASLDVRAAARPHMTRLAESAQASVYLAIRDDLEMVLIEVCSSSATVLLTRVDLGSRLPITNSALGRAYLSALEPANRRALLDRIRAAGSQTWQQALPGLERGLQEAALKGYCVCAGEWHPDINSVAVPLVGPTGEAMAMVCGGPAFRFSADCLRDEIAPKLLRTAQAIARDIGGAVPEPVLKGAPVQALRALARPGRQKPERAPVPAAQETQDE